MFTLSMIFYEVYNSLYSESESVEYQRFTMTINGLIIRCPNIIEQLEAFPGIR